MAYTVDFKGEGEINPTIPGKTAIVIPNNNINTTATSLVLTGKGVSNWGEIQQENFVRLLDNFASQTPPPNPTVGQLWFDSVNDMLKIFDMTQTWIPVGSVVVAGAEPIGAIQGQLWFNSSEQILYVKIASTGNMSLVGPRYFSGSWAQVWPAPEHFASIVEYNTVAARLNKVIGAPQVSGTDPDVANNQWGWGETDVVPTYSSYNAPSQFDNNAWVIFLSRLKKATRHIDQTLAPEANIPTHGFIKDGRGWGNTTATTYSPNTTWTAGWGGAGIYTQMTTYDTLLTAITALEDNRFTIATTDTQWSVIATQTRPSWKQTKVLNVDVTFATATEMARFFNAGGQIRLTFDISGYVTAIAQAWDTLFTTTVDLVTGGVCLDYKGTRITPTGAYYNGTSSIGFYDLTTSYQTIYTVARGGSYGTGSLLIEAKKTGTTVINLQITFNEDYTAGDPSIDGTTSVGVQVRRSLGSVNGVGPSINTPAIALPTAATSGTFVTAPAE